MNLNNRIERMTIQANEILRQKKSDILVLIAPSNNKKGWIVDGCHNYKNGKEDIVLREQLEACNTFDELILLLDGHTTNIPNVRRSNEYK